MCVGGEGVSQVAVATCSVSSYIFPCPHCDSIFVCVLCVHVCNPTYSYKLFKLRNIFSSTYCVFHFMDVMGLFTWPILEDLK